MIHNNNRKIDLIFKDVSFSYGNTPVLEGATFHIHEKEFISLVGPNGSGKTTILKLILGLEKPLKGVIKLLGEDPQKTRHRVGYLPQLFENEILLPVLTKDVVRMGKIYSLSRYKKNDADIDRVIEQTNISDFVNKPFYSLSGGQKRRALLARALVSDPDFLILDEPTTGMDEESESRFFNTLKSIKGKKTVLIITHNMDFVSPLTDRVFCTGEKNKSGYSAKIVVQHKFKFLKESPVDSSGEKLFKVLHEESFLADDCKTQRKD